MNGRSSPAGEPQPSRAAKQDRPDCSGRLDVTPGPFVMSTWAELMTALTNDVADVGTSSLADGDGTPDEILDLLELVRCFELDLIADVERSVRLGCALALEMARAGGELDG